MDGNNRYGKKNQLATGEGHRVGKNQLDPIVEYCREIGVQALTVFAFSSENWNRPAQEIKLLMALLEESIHEQMSRMERYQIALRFIGDRNKVSPHLAALMDDAERKTAHYNKMTLTIAMSYGGKWDISYAAQQIARQVQVGKLSPEQINEDIFHRYTCLNDLPPVDILIRTGGDYRLSNFLIWQSAYAELFFTDTLWPDFTVEELQHIFKQFSQRERRFGRTSEQIQQEQ